ncbi:HipA domain-containing protein [Pedobacter nutrimenti]|uniref:HipA domain-containing protein n=1 Tax=Pedobacter nutrimenti TaxID=1241337 RepID=UPI002931ABFB|nr:HipA domain-containing protein [Pedobacter nutrimenti]
MEYSLGDMDKLARDVVERSIAIPGVQPKLSLTLVSQSLDQGNAPRLTVVGAMGGNYIFKPPFIHYPYMPENEHVTMRIAEGFGIPVVMSSLIRLGSGELGYITKRIDRTKEGGKIHMLDMFQILEAFDKYKSSMEKVGKAIGDYSVNTQLDRLYYFELALFCFVSGNSDMHLKNFSMILSSQGWILSPAYDLLNVSLANPTDNEELALTLGAKKRKIGRPQFDELAERLELTTRQKDRAYNRLQKNQNTAVDWVEKSFLPDDVKERYLSIMASRYKQLGM